MRTTACCGARHRQQATLPGENGVKMRLSDMHSVHKHYCNELMMRACPSVPLVTSAKVPFDVRDGVRPGTRRLLYLKVAERNRE